MNQIGPFILLGLSLWLAPPPAAPHPLPATIPADLQRGINQVDTLAASEWSKDKLGGATIGVVTDSGLVWTKSYGYADTDQKLPATRDTIYRIGSITKQFTAVMLLQLVAERTVHLSDPVEKFFSEVNRIQGRSVNAPPITLIQLATMTSGLATEPNDLPTFLKGPVADWEKILVAALARTRYAYEPGTRFHYSNIGYAILGAALGRAAGRPYVDYIRERIFLPLAMTHSAFEPNERMRPHLATGYAIENGTVNAAKPASEHAGRGYKVPNGAMYTTIDDLARFMAFELGGGPESVLKKTLLETNFARLNSATGDLNSAYGIGFMVFRHGNLLVHGHGGAVAGYVAEAVFHRRSRAGVIVLRNVSGGKFDVAGLALQALDKLVTSRQGAAR